MTVAQNYHTSEMRCVLPVRVGQSPPSQGEKSILIARAHKRPECLFLELGRNDHLLERYAAEENFFADLR